MGELAYAAFVSLVAKFLFWVVFLPLALIFLGYLVFIIVESIKEWRKK